MREWKLYNPILILEPLNPWFWLGLFSRKSRVVRYISFADPYQFSIPNLYGTEELYDSGRGRLSAGNPIGCAGCTLARVRAKFRTRIVDPGEQRAYH